jgi:hypothetical protein
VIKALSALWLVLGAAYPGRVFWKWWAASQAWRMGKMEKQGMF